MDNLKIELKYDKGFSWHNEDGSYFKGYLFKNDQYLEGLSALKYLKELIVSEKNINLAIKELSGIFSFIYCKEDEVIVCVDRVRTFPIYYKSSGNKIVISDDAKICSESENKIDENSSIEFLHTGYVTGRNTLLKEVFQIQAGEYLVFKEGSLQDHTYHRYITENRTEKDLGSASITLSKTLENIADRLANSLQGKTAIIPLSGGFDSRLIAVMLKNRGVKDVICFTYGRKGNPEVEISEKVAKALAFEWHFIEYSEELIKDYIGTEEFKQYFKFSANYTSMFYMQEYFAIRELKNLIPNNSVFIPGHSGDFFAGSHLDKDIIISTKITEITEQILEKHYNLRKLTLDTRSVLLKKIKDQLKKVAGQLAKESKNIDYSHYENWDLKERQAKFIVNSSRIYEYFGFEHRLPLMDNELIDYFNKIDVSLKLNKVLYDKVIKENYFQKYDLNFDNEIQATANDIRMQKIKEFIKKVLPAKIINKYKYSMNKLGDTYYYIEITNYMKKELTSSGINIDETGRDKNSIIVQWYLYKIGEKI
ncbi:MAG: asparagine synthase-related protein [Candidatus Delongbacteria bacterium]|jgi:asparagine synthase (glutamine-hydrolysing)|nr:asparagine synthase-related protein [Candidatus Delongbacteria bacterium]